jgi:hypothetical protein
MKRLVERVPERVSCSFLALSLFAVAFVATAAAQHVRPKGGTPKLDPLVIAYKDCASATLAHDMSAPKQPSCPASGAGNSQTSGYLTAGTPDYNGLPANFTGNVRMDVCPVPGCAAPDIKVGVVLKDVRCNKDLASVTPAVCVGGAFGPYVGSVKAKILMKTTDHCNTPVFQTTCPASPGTSATTQAVPFEIDMLCTDPGTGVGSTCQASTTYNAVLAGSIQSGQKMNVETTVTVDDGGADGNASTAPNTLYATEGVFVP